MYRYIFFIFSAEKNTRLNAEETKQKYEFLHSYYPLIPSFRSQRVHQVKKILGFYLPFS